MSVFTIHGGSQIVYTEAMTQDGAQLLQKRQTV